MANNTSNNHNYCVILAGGKGRRLWPCSRERLPKQFLDFFGTGRTQLQQTFDRYATLVGRDHIYVSTNHDYAALVAEQLPELPVANILSEPIHRNTAPSVAWASYRISHQCADACLVVTPADQVVFDETAFRQSAAQGFDFVGHHDSLLAVGVKPTRPEPGYGYIQVGDESGGDGLYRVKSFTEKPERDFARLFMESGEFFWNTSIFFANVRHLITRLKTILPSVMHNNELAARTMTIDEEVAYVAENFPRYPNLSLDAGILDKPDNVYVMRGQFGWADLGTWHSAHEAMSRGQGDNVVIHSNVEMENCHDNIVKIPHDHLAVINGLDGYIVAEEGNVLLICRKEDSSALIRKYVNEVQLKYGSEFV